MSTAGTVTDRTIRHRIIGAAMIEAMAASRPTDRGGR